MQQAPRKKLGLKSAATAVESPFQGAEFDLLRLAIDRRLCMTATYNRQSILFAPHILYTRHDDPFVDGVVMQREGKVPVELKLGTFKLAGLNGLTLTPEAFQRFEAFDSTDAKYEGVTLAIVN